jgi:SMODS-associating 4TM effector domain
MALGDNVATPRSQGESMSAPRPGIATRQNAPEILLLVRAMTAAHARVQRLEAVRLSISVVVALTAIVAAVFPWLATTVGALGAGWALLQGLGVSVLVQRETSRAALAQEIFDVTLFEIEWNQIAAGDRLPAAEISLLARSYRGPDDLIRDYYEVPDLRRPYDVIACQEQNLAWGGRVRRRFATTVLAGLIGWPLLGAVVGVALQMSVGRLLLVWYLPALGVLMMGSDLFRRQRDTATTRTRVLGIVRDRLAGHLRGQGSTEDLLVLARQVQDVILATRRMQPRVPDWFFLRFRPQDRIDFEREMTELASDVAGQPGRPSP